MGEYLPPAPCSRRSTDYRYKVNVGPYPVMGGGSVTPLYGLCRYGKSQRVQFFCHFGLTWGINLAILIINRVMVLFSNLELVKFVRRSYFLIIINNNDHQRETFINYVLDNCASRNGHSLQAGSHLGAHARAAKSGFESEAILREESGDEARRK